MVNPIGFSINGSGTGYTRLSLGLIEPNKPIIVDGYSIVSTDTLSIDSFSSDYIELGTSYKSDTGLIRVTSIENIISGRNLNNSNNRSIISQSIDNTVSFGVSEVPVSGESGQTYINCYNDLFFRVANSVNTIYHMDENSFNPGNNADKNLGTTTFRWDDIYFAGILDLESTAAATVKLKAATSVSDSSIKFGTITNDSVGYIKLDNSIPVFNFYISNVPDTAGTNKLTLSYSSLYPSTTNGLALGSSSNRWGVIYNSGIINCTSSTGDSYLTLRAGSTTAGAFINFGDSVTEALGIISYSNVNNCFDLMIEGTPELKLTSASLTPYTTSGLTLGSASLRWGDLYINNVLDIESSSGPAYIEIKSDIVGSDSYIKFGIAADDNLGQIKFDTTNNLFNFSITTSGADEKLSLTATALYPYTTSGLTLGTSSLRWGSIYNDGIIDCESNTGVSYIRLKAKDTNYLSTIFFGTELAYNNGSISVNNQFSDMTISSDNDMFFNANTESITFNGSEFYSTVTNNIDLGNTSHYWKELYSNYVNTKQIIVTPLTVGTSTNIYLRPASSLVNASLYMGTNDFCRINYYESSKTISILNDSSSDYGIILNATNLYPNPSNTVSLGSASNKWNTVYAVTGAIDTSDERQKKDITSINDKVLDAWEEISPVFYKWINSVNEKGYNARIHSGLISQRIKETFAKHGLDAHQYGLFCYDEWPEKIEKTIKKLEDGTEKNIERIIPAGNSYGIRSVECLFVEAAYQRRKVNLINKKLEIFETKLTNIETKLNS